MDEQNITIEQAAEILRVSERTVVKILDDGEIPFHMAGSHRAILLGDLNEYRNKRDARRREAMEELYRISEENSLYEIKEFPKKED